MTGIIDCDSLLFVMGNGNKVLNGEGNPTLDDKGRFIYVNKTEEEMQKTADELMNDILTSSGATGYIAYIKGRGTTTERIKINPEYKSNRPKESPWWWNFCKNYLIEKWKAVVVNDYEVDDFVSVTKKLLPDSFIIAVDKDLLGLEGKHYNWKKKEWVEVSKKQEEYNFWASMVTGDAADGIKGIPGKGPKFAKDVIDEVINTNSGSLEGNILFQYVRHFGEYKAIKQFYQNYYSLKILDEIEGFIVPEIIKFKEESNGETEKEILF